MKFVAYLPHKYFMHVILWKLGKDYYKNTKKASSKKRCFFIIFAISGDTLMIFGASKNYNLISWIDLEVALYGLVYLLIHEIYIHRRFRFTKNQK
jgi:beta-carotene 3-hydroxylase